MIGVVYIVAGFAVVGAGMVLIGRQRRRMIGSLTLFVGFNLVLLGYALLRGLGD